ncbi:MAG: (deoxy)nucleoside triphosphate pyrophosphohydrolase [bacterium]
MIQKVTAGVIHKDGKILIARRKSGKCVGANWEFPGGKLEEGETLEECLIRELKEELDIEVEIINYIDSNIFFCGDKKIELVAYNVKYISGKLKLVDHEEAKWVLPDKLLEYKFTLPDIPIAEKVLNLFS